MTHCGVLAPGLGTDSSDLPGFGKQGKGQEMGAGATPEPHQPVLPGGTGLLSAGRTCLESSELNSLGWGAHR